MILLKGLELFDVWIDVFIVLEVVCLSLWVFWIVFWSVVNVVNGVLWNLFEDSVMLIWFGDGVMGSWFEVCWLEDGVILCRFEGMEGLVWFGDSVIRNWVEGCVLFGGFDDSMIL